MRGAEVAAVVVFAGNISNGYYVVADKLYPGCVRSVSAVVISIGE